MKKLKFLLVDDSASTNFFNKVMIEKSSVSKEIRIAKNGKEGLKVLNSSFIPNFILLDINMPTMNGWEFLEEFQKLDFKFNNVMIILMLGAELSETKKKLIKTIPNIKGSIEKMLNKDIIADIVEKYQENLVID